MPNLKFHHVGCVVASIPEALESYRPMARTVGEIIAIATQGVNICFIEIGPGTHVELVEPSAGDESIIGRLLKKRISYYHLGFLTQDFDAAIEDLVANDYRHLNTFRSEAFGMRRCAFLANPGAHLIEIIEERPTEA
jgi:catechol 2,3-dioxygenase-like lactoylglutathione lyase family enzyme